MANLTKKKTRNINISTRIRQFEDLFESALKERLAGYEVFRRIDPGWYWSVNNMDLILHVFYIRVENPVRIDVTETLPIKNILGRNWDQVATTMAISFALLLNQKAGFANFEPEEMKHVLYPKREWLEEDGIDW